MLRPGMNEHVSYAIDDARVRKNNSQWAKIRIKVQHSLLDNAPNYVGSWVHYPKEIYLHTFNPTMAPKFNSTATDEV